MQNGPKECTYARQVKNNVNRGLGVKEKVPTSKDRETSNALRGGEQSLSIGVMLDHGHPPCVSGQSFSRQYSLFPPTRPLIMSSWEVFNK